MALIERLARVLRADLNACLERLENPLDSLRLAIEDMDGDINRVSAEHARKMQRREQGVRRIGEIDAQLKATGDDVDKALTNGREDLARAVLRRRLTAERERDCLVAEQGEIDEHAETLLKLLDERQAVLAELRAELRMLERSGSASATGGPGCVSEAEVELALLAAKQDRAAS